MIIGRHIMIVWYWSGKKWITSHINRSKTTKIRMSKGQLGCKVSSLSLKCLRTNFYLRRCRNTLSGREWVSWWDNNAATWKRAVDKTCRGWQNAQYNSWIKIARTRREAWYHYAESNWISHSSCNWLKKPPKLRFQCYALTWNLFLSAFQTAVPSIAMDRCCGVCMDRFILCSIGTLGRHRCKPCTANIFFRRRPKVIMMLSYSSHFYWVWLPV